MVQIEQWKKESRRLVLFQSKPCIEVHHIRKDEGNWASYKRSVSNGKKSMYNGAFDFRYLAALLQTLDVAELRGKM